jgi:hypothetical protein
LSLKISAEYAPPNKTISLSAGVSAAEKFNLLVAIATIYLSALCRGGIQL